MRRLLLVLAVLLAACAEEEAVEAKILPVDFISYGLSCSPEGAVESVRLQVKNTGNSSLSIDSILISGASINSTSLPLALGVGETKAVLVSPAGAYLSGLTSVTTRTADVQASGSLGNFTKQMVFKGTRCP